MFYENWNKINYYSQALDYQFHIYKVSEIITLYLVIQNQHVVFMFGDSDI